MVKKECVSRKAIQARERVLERVIIVIILVLSGKLGIGHAVSGNLIYNTIQYISAELRNNETY